MAAVYKRSSDGEIEKSSKRAKVEKQNQEERQFTLLFEDMLNNFIQVTEIPEEEITNGIDSIIESFRYAEGNKFSDINLNHLNILCGYLFRYGSHGAGLVRKRIVDSLDECIDLKHIFAKPKLNIVSLGGGPGNDIVGLCSALYELNKNSELNITVTDSAQRFLSCVKILEFLIREGNYGIVSEMFRKRSVKMSFMQFTLFDSTNIECLKTLKEADIILACKLFSILDENEEEKMDIIQKLHYLMKSSAILLYIDSPFYPELWENFDILYKSESEEYAKSVITERFEHNDRVSSKAQIAVLRKK